MGSIKGLPSPKNYAKLDAIRTVSIRKLGRVIGTKDGKIVDEEIRKKINRAIQELFIDKEHTI